MAEDEFIRELRHVPLIVRLPKDERAGQRTRALSELVDLYPTLSDLCGLTAPDYIDGKSLKAVLNDPSKSVKDAAFTQVRRGNFDGYSIRTDRFRFTQWDGGKKGEQLYDMQADPGETKNLVEAPEHAQTLQQLRQRLADYARTAQ